VKRSDNTIGYRLLTLSSDASLSLLQDGKVAWTRDEALAYVDEVEFVDLPVDSPLGGSTDGYPNLFQRIGPQISQLVHGVQSIMKNPASLIAKPARGVAANVDGALVQDHFGFRKIVVVATTYGKLYGLNSESGDIVWSRFLVAPSGAPSWTSSAKAATTIERIWRVYRQHYDMVSVITRTLNGDGNVTHSTVYHVNPFNGAVDTKATTKIDADVCSSVRITHVHVRQHLYILFVFANHYFPFCQ
jgi:hypothetical protein